MVGVVFGVHILPYVGSGVGRYELALPTGVSVVFDKKKGMEDNIPKTIIVRI
jgi:hypothetical protein